MVFLCSCSRNEFDAFLAAKDTGLDFAGKYHLLAHHASPFIILGEDKANSNKLKLRILDIKNMQEALSRAQNEVQLKMVSFNISTVPYPGQMTHSTSCDPALLPKIVGQKQLRFLYFKVSDRLGPIVCQEEKSFYHAYMTFFADNSERHLLVAEFYFKEHGRTMELNNFIDKHFKGMKPVKINLP